MSNKAPFITGDINNGKPLVLVNGKNYDGIIKLTDFVFNPTYDPDSTDITTDISGNFLTFGPDGASGSSLTSKENLAPYKINDLPENLTDVTDFDEWWTNNKGSLGTFGQNKFFDLDIIDPGDTLLYEVFINEVELSESDYTNDITFIQGVLSINLENPQSLAVGDYKIKFKVTDLEGDYAEQEIILFIIESSNEFTVYDGWNLIGAPVDCELHKESESNTCFI